MCPRGGGLRQSCFCQLPCTGDGCECLQQRALLFPAFQTCPCGYRSANGCPSIYLQSISITPAAPFSDSHAFRSSLVAGSCSRPGFKASLLDLGKAVGSDPCSAVICLCDLGVS